MEGGGPLSTVRGIFRPRSGSASLPVLVDGAGSTGDRSRSTERRTSSSSGTTAAPASRAGERRASPNAQSTPIDIRPRPSRSGSGSASQVNSLPSALPHYSPSPSSSALASPLDAPIPSYDSVLSQAAEGLRSMRMQSFAAALGQTPGEDAPMHAQEHARSAWQGLQTQTQTQMQTGEDGHGDDDDDDPLVPRLRRLPPAMPQRRMGMGMRRNTFSGTSSAGARERRGSEVGTFPRGLVPPREEDVFEEDEEDDDGGQGARSGEGQGQDVVRGFTTRVRAVEAGNGETDTTVQGGQGRALAPPHAISVTIPASVTTERDTVPAIVDPSFESELAMQPLPPPISLLPAYSAHLAPEEIRLISTVHQDESHPSQAFFTALANSLVHAMPTPADDPQREQPTELQTGGRKMRLVLTRGGIRMNQNQTGPMYVKLGRGGRIEGRIEVGRVDYATSLEVSIIGLVNTSYYVRGQYTLIDTLPLVRRQVKLYPEEQQPEDVVRDDFATLSSATSAPATATATTTAASPAVATPTTASNGAVGGSDVASSATQAPTTVTPSTPTSPTSPLARISAFQKQKKVGKDGVPYLVQGQSFSFSLTMPHSHYRDGSSELPPSCQIYQVGMQAGVEYVMRVKMGRKGWRMNETITIPIIYEPRAYITPRRLRALTTNDALNPGWRTIRLHGGKPTPKAAPAAPAPSADDPGVEATLLLPSPPILYFAQCEPAPPIPFHLHFHSSLPLPLETFSDPRKSNFVIRLMRVATLRIGSEKEIRRMEIPSVVEIWQEGGPRGRIGDAVGAGGSVAGFRVSEAPPTEAGAGTAMAMAGDGEMGAGGGIGADEHGQGAEAQAMPVSPGATSVPLPPAATPILPTTPATTTATTTTPTSPTSPAASTDRRRLSFLRRRSTTDAHPSPLARVLSNIPPIHEHDTAAGNTTGTPGADGETGAAHAHAPAPAPEPSIFTPVAPGCTDMHLLGQLTISPKIAGTEVARRMVQSFNTPDIGITYVLEIGIQPRPGAVREAFDHVWGGGIVEVVLAPKLRDGEGEAVMAA